MSPLDPTSTLPSTPRAQPPRAARVEVRAWLAHTAALDAGGATDSTPPAAAAWLHLGAEGLCADASARHWYVAYADLEDVRTEPNRVLLALAGGRGIALHTPAPDTLQRHLDTRLTAYARHAILAQRMTPPLPTAPTSHLLGAIENPATPRALRAEIASWLGTRPLEPGDALYLSRIVRDIADPALAHQIALALELELPAAS